MNNTNKLNKKGGGGALSTISDSIDDFQNILHPNDAEEVIVLPDLLSDMTYCEILELLGRDYLRKDRKLPIRLLNIYTRNEYGGEDLMEEPEEIQGITNPVQRITSEQVNTVKELFQADTIRKLNRNLSDDFVDCEQHENRSNFWGNYIINVINHGPEDIEQFNLLVALHNPNFVTRFNNLKSDYFDIYPTYNIGDHDEIHAHEPIQLLIDFYVRDKENAKITQENLFKGQVEFIKVINELTTIILDIDDALVFNIDPRLPNNIENVIVTYFLNDSLFDTYLHITERIIRNVHARNSSIKKQMLMKRLGDKMKTDKPLDNKILGYAGVRGGGKKKVTYWRDIKPDDSSIDKYYKKYGKKCFLLPSQLKYPICDKNTGKPHCKGLLAAHYRAALSTYRKLKPKSYSYHSIMRKARKIANKQNCNWSKNKSSKKGGGNVLPTLSKFARDTLQDNDLDTNDNSADLENQLDQNDINNPNYYYSPSTSETEIKSKVMERSPVRNKLRTDSPVLENTNQQNSKEKIAKKIKMLKSAPSLKITEPELFRIRSEKERREDNKKENMEGKHYHPTLLFGGKKGGGTYGIFEQYFSDNIYDLEEKMEKEKTFYENKLKIAIHNKEQEKARKIKDIIERIDVIIKKIPKIIDKQEGNMLFHKYNQPETPVKLPREYYEASDFALFFRDLQQKYNDYMDFEAQNTQKQAIGEEGPETFGGKKKKKTRKNNITSISKDNMVKKNKSRKLRGGKKAPERIEDPIPQPPQRRQEVPEIPEDFEQRFADAREIIVNEGGNARTDDVRNNIIRRVQLLIPRGGFGAPGFVLMAIEILEEQNNEEFSEILIQSYGLRLRQGGKKSLKKRRKTKRKQNKKRKTRNKRKSRK